MSNMMYLKNTRGFTLIEVMIASTIGAFISLVAVATLKSVIVSNEMVDQNIESSSEIRFAANMIQKDLVNFYNTPDINNTEFIGTIEELDSYRTPIITFYVINRTKARPAQPEGDIYEVEYYLKQSGEESGLIRRMLPNPDPNMTTLGIESVIAENINSFEVSYYDGQEWYDDWPQDIGTLPQLIEVVIEAKQTGKGLPIVEFFVVNFARNIGVTSDQASSG
jgi:type II secretion system protein J